MKIKVFRNLLEILHLKYYPEKKLSHKHKMCSKLTTDSYAIYNAVQKYEIKQVLPDLVKFINN